MILLKANLELKTVFQKMIKTMGENVKWTEIFVINNNDIILTGKGRSLFFNFDNKRTNSILVDLAIDEEKAVRISQNTLLENTLNMILYAFGKWGGIKGLKVEQNYDQLNKLINSIFAELSIEAKLTMENFRFYKSGIQITYEEVIQAILDQMKPQQKAPEEENKKESEEAKAENKKEEIVENQEEMPSEYEMGLWHKMCWTSGKFAFVNENFSENDRKKSRLGNDFYMVKYKCPICSEKLYMVVYPIGREFRVETDREPLYMARAYTCKTCQTFYTPIPHKLLIDGEVFHLNFQDDTVAYEDYLELLGRRGRRTSNYNLNVYESEYNKGSQEEPKSLEEVLQNRESLSHEEFVELKEKMDSGFYPSGIVEKYYEKIDQELQNRVRTVKRNKEAAPDIEENPVAATKAFQKKRNSESKESKAPKLINQSPQELDEQEEITEQAHTDKEVVPEEGLREYAESERFLHEKGAVSKVFQGIKEILASIHNGDWANFDSRLEGLSVRQFNELKGMVHADKSLAEKDRSHVLDRIDKILYIEKEKAIKQKVAASEGKTYEELVQIIEEIEREDFADSFKKPILASLLNVMEKRGRKELECLVAQIPENMSRKQFEQFREKIVKYKKMDNSPQIKYLEEKRDIVEKQEIAATIKRANAKNRRSLFDLYHKLKEQGFEERNVKSYLDKIYDRIVAFDEEAIRKICPEPADVSFEEGLQAYKEIEEGNFLPELKVNVLGLIEKRLMKMKMDESEQLVIKLIKDMQSIEEDDPRVYFYEVRKMMKGDMDQEKSIIINNALNTYASERGKYEYPLLICDASLSANGGVGFVLTPDHIFYNGLLSLGTINIKDIESIYADAGFLAKGIYVKTKHSDKIKISNSLKSNKLKSFAKELNDFVNYLKEKPESRNISYMAKEKHTEKCCYRCGYFYKGGNVCPKCGSKFNE